MTLKTEVLDAIDTEGVSVEDVQAQPIEDRPLFSIPMAVKWARDPANAPKIEEFAKHAGEAQEEIMHQIDDTLTRTKDVIVDILMNDETETSIVNDLIGHFFGVRD